MYPATLQKNPTHTIDSSEVFETWTLQKKPKIIGKTTNSWDKNTVKDLEQVRPKHSHGFSAWLLSAKTSLPGILLSFGSVLSCTHNFLFSILNLGENIEKVKFLDFDKTFHNTYVLTLNDAFSKQFCPGLRTVKCSLVSERLTCINPHCFISEILNSETAVMLQVFHLFTH